MLFPIAGKKAKEVAAKIGPLLRHNSKRLLAVPRFRDLIVCRGKHVASNLAIITLVSDYQKSACSCGLHLPLNDHREGERKRRALAKL